MKRFLSAVIVILTISAIVISLGATTASAAWYGSATTMSANSSYSATISSSGQYKYFRYTPSASAYYVIYSTGSADTYVHLFNSSGSQLSYNDDGGDNHNFRLEYYLNAGTEYIFGIRYYSSSSTGTISFKFGNTYTVNYNSNGGSGVPSSQTKDYARTLTLSTTTPTRSGYTFKGWATSSTATVASYQPGDSYSSNANLTLYAVWQKIPTALSLNNSYTTTISTAGEMNYFTYTPSTTATYVIYSTGSVDTKCYLYNSSGSQITSDDDSGDGTNFRLSYSLTAGTTYTFGIRYYSSSTTGTISFKFGGVYTVSYNANGGSGAPSSQSLDYGQTITLSSTVPTRSNYSFLGWSTSSTATSASYSAGGSYARYSNTTLYAVWQQVRSLSSISVYSLPSKTTYYPGESLNSSGLTIRLNYSNGTTEYITSGFSLSGFSSDSMGTKTVTVTYSGKTTSFTVSVVARPVTSVTLNKSSGSITDIQTLQLTATVTPDNATYKTITWSSSDTAVATVSSDGLVRGISAGMATITATAPSGVSASATITVTRHTHSYVSEVTTAPTCRTTGVRTYSCSYCDYSYTETVPADAYAHICASSPTTVTAATCTQTGLARYFCSVCGSRYSRTTILPSSTYPESDHEYSNNLSRDYEFVYEGASELYITFSDNTEFENRWDHLTVYDASGSLFAEYTGTALAGQTIVIDGDKFTLRLTTDSSVTRYGFAITSIKAVTYVDDVIIPVTEHSLTSAITLAPTCTNAGVKTYSCANCSYTQDEAIPVVADAHIWGDWQIVVAPTCVEDGYKAKQCSECQVMSAGRVTLPSSIYPQSPHSYENSMNTTYNFSYTGAQTLYLTFSSSTSFETNCDYLYIYDSDGGLVGRYTGTTLANRTITISGNSFSLVLSTDHSVTRYGFSFSKIEADCYDVGEDLYQELPATGEHDYSSSVITTATCMSGGEVLYSCRNCTESYTQATETDSSNHAGGTQINGAFEAFCGSEGYTGDTYCLGCNAKLADGSVIPATGIHSYTSRITTPATCKTAGVRLYTCTGCSNAYTESLGLDSSNHEGGTQLRDAETADCGNVGYTGDTYCLGCNVVIRSGEIIRATGDHNYESSVTREPSCSTAGVRTHVCTVCEDSYTTSIEKDSTKHTGLVTVLNQTTADCGNDGYSGDTYCSSCMLMLSSGSVIPATGDHNYSDSVTTIPTCNAAGVRTYTCAVCNDQYTENIAADKSNHVGGTETRNRTEVDCNNDGYTGDICCKGCNDVLTYGSVIPATSAHTYASEVTLTATCCSAGTTKYTCTICGNYYTESTDFDPSVHAGGTEVRNATDSTCVVKGYTGDRYCLGCNTMLSEGSEKALLTHKRESVAAVAPTCTSTGLTDGVSCPGCGKVYRAQEEIPMIPHTARTVAGTSATCTQSGLTEGSVCSECNTVLTAQETIPATGHSEEIIPAVAATCTQTGLTEGRRCSACGEITSAQETIPVTAHSEEIIPAVAATCTQTGLTEGRRCSVCGEITSAQETISATGHTEEKIPAVAATCTKNGLSSGKKCSVCGEITKAQTETPKADHDYAAVVTAPTCTEKGYTTRTCSVCSHSYVSDETPATGHTEGEWVVVTPAEEGKEGLEQITCTTCGTVTQQRAIPAIDNSFVPGDVNGDGKITASDARLALRISAKVDTPDERQTKAADITGDGKITAADARKILRMAAKIE